jgi:hypothetical protein
VRRRTEPRVHDVAFVDAGVHAGLKRQGGGKQEKVARR